jgi:hypothetical protein
LCSKNYQGSVAARDGGAVIGDDGCDGLWIMEICGNNEIMQEIMASLLPAKTL